MRIGIIPVCAFVLVNIPAAAQNRARAIGPVGLVMSAGATLVRGAHSLAAKPGEVLFNGDSLRTGDSAATFLFCPQKQSATLAPGSEVVFAQESYQVRSGSIGQQRPVAACFLPPAQKLSVASMQHYGVLVARAGSVRPPDTTQAQRIDALPEPVRNRLRADLDVCDAALARDPNDLSGVVGKAASFEHAGLLYDAVEAYRKIAQVSPNLGWVAAKIAEIEANREREQLKKE